MSDGVVLLRRFQLEDAERLQAWAEEPDLRESRWMCVPPDCQAPQAREILTRLRGEWGGGDELTSFALCLLPSGPTGGEAELVGLLDARRLEDGEGLELSYGIAPQWRGRGLVPRALLLFRERAEREQLRYLLLRIQPDKHASRRVASKTGFTLLEVEEGVHPQTGERYVDELWVCPLHPERADQSSPGRA